MIPVYISKNSGMPSLLIDNKNLVCCTGFSVQPIPDSNNFDIIYNTVEVTKGIPRELNLDEAAFRCFLGQENMKKITKKVTSYKKQKKLLENILKSKPGVGLVGWCQWNFLGDKPVPIIKETEEKLLLLVSYHVAPNSIKTDSCQGYANIIEVNKEDVIRVSSDYALEYLWCGAQDVELLYKSNMWNEYSRIIIWEGMMNT